jgi:hypothetical protein
MSCYQAQKYTELDQTLNLHLATNGPNKMLKTVSDQQLHIDESESC